MQTKKAMVGAAVGALLLATGVGSTAHALLDDNNSNVCGQAGAPNCSNNVNPINTATNGSTLDVEGGGGNQGNGGIVNKSSSKTGGTSAKSNNKSAQNTRGTNNIRGGGNLSLTLH